MPPDPTKYADCRILARTFENQVLYRMCMESSQHVDPAVNAGKIILIGRAYAASPQRGAGAARDKTQDFFDAMGKALAESDLDKRLAEVAPLDHLDEASLRRIVGIHTYLVDTLLAATKVWSEEGTEPRRQPSFASKYLHFHRPNAFPLMDSRAKDGLRKGKCGGDFATYEAFCDSILRFARNQPNPNCTLREIDGLLLGASR